MDVLKVFKTLTGKYQLTGKCCSCHTPKCVTLGAQDYFDWNQGKHAQHAFPYLTADQCEFLISRMCGKCFDKLFDDPTEDQPESSEGRKLREAIEKGNK